MNKKELQDTVIDLQDIIAAEAIKGHDADMPTLEHYVQERNSLARAVYDIDVLNDLKKNINEVTQAIQEVDNLQKTGQESLSLNIFRSFWQHDLEYMISRAKHYTKAKKIEPDESF